MLLLSVDIHSKLPFLSMKSGLRTAQLATLLFGITGIAFAYVMATWEVKSLWDEFNKILGLILGSMGGLFLLGMTTKRAYTSGAICGIITSVIIQILMIHYQCVHLLLYTTTGFISWKETAVWNGCLLHRQLLQSSCYYLV